MLMEIKTIPNRTQIDVEMTPSEEELEKECPGRKETWQLMTIPRVQKVRETQRRTLRIGLEEVVNVETQRVREELTTSKKKGAIKVLLAEEKEAEGQPVTVLEEQMSPEGKITMKKETPPSRVRTSGMDLGKQ